MRRGEGGEREERGGEYVIIQNWGKGEGEGGEKEKSYFFGFELFVVRALNEIVPTL